MFGFLNGRVAKKGGLRRIGLVALFAGLCLPLAAASTARGDDISSGTYTGSTGGSFDGVGFPGGNAYNFNGSNPDSLVSGGTFTGGTGGGASGNPEVNVGGQGGDAVAVSTSNGSLAITGGSFTGGSGGDASGASGANNAGGEGGEAVDADNGGIVTVSGGAFTPGGGGTGEFDVDNFVLYSTAPSGVDFYADGDAVITLVGTFQDAPTSPITSGSGTITGTLADNSTVGTYSFDVTGSGEIILAAPVPEPIALSSIIAAGSAVLLKRRRLA